MRYQGVILDKKTLQYLTYFYTLFSNNPTAVAIVVRENLCEVGLKLEPNFYSSSYKL